MLHAMLGCPCPRQASKMPLLGPCCPGPVATGAKHPEAHANPDYGASSLLMVGLRCFGRHAFAVSALCQLCSMLVPA
jgi:hypothetical protein